jgi:hypothetical protein
MAPLETGERAYSSLTCLAWGDRWGPAAIVGMLDAMQAWYGGDRYRPSVLLRRIAAADGSLT